MYSFIHSYISLLAIFKIYQTRGVEFSSYVLLTHFKKIPVPLDLYQKDVSKKHFV